MSESFYVCRVWAEPGKPTRFSYISKNFGWCKHFAEARSFPSKDAATAQLNGRSGSIWPESELKASPYYRAEIESMSHALEKTNPNSPVQVTATWDGVRHWLNAAKMFEQGKLFSQVMIGFELLALKKAHGVVNGNNQHEGRVSQNGKPTEDWETILQKEAGLAQTTAYRYMDMAKVAMPRLKKLPALKGFNPLETPLSKLPETTRTAMETAVKKLTDGKSQMDFLGELYKQGGGNHDAKGGNARGEKTTAEQAEAAFNNAMENSGWMGKAVAASNKDFFLTARENDIEVDAQIAVLEFALKLRTKYRNTPRAKREAAVAEILHDIAQNDPLRQSELAK